MTQMERDAAIAAGLAVVGVGGYLYWRTHRTVINPVQLPPTSTATSGSTTATGSQVVKTDLVYQRNCYSCLYFYRIVNHLSDGTTHDGGIAVRTKNKCAGLKHVKYVGLKYLTNHHSTYYKYAVYVYFTNGTRKQVDTIWHKGPITNFVCN